MKSKSRLAAVLLVIAMVLSTTSWMVTAAPVLTDIRGHRAEADITYLMDLRVLHGHPDGTFLPNANLRRSEAVKIIIWARHGNDSAARPLFGTSPFTDVPGTHWASGYIALARNLGIVEGRGAGIFDPEGWVTYAEFAKMLVEAAGLRPVAGLAWPANYVEAARTAGIVVAAELPAFVAGRPATRGDAAIMATNAVADVRNPATGLTLARSVFGRVAPAERGGILRVAIVSNPPTLDIVRTTAAVTHFTMWHVFEAPFTLGANYGPIPHLFTNDWTVTPDGLTYTFNLRRGIRFHHGREMTSDDIVASLERWGAHAPWGRMLWEVKESLTTRGTYVVVLKLREPSPLVPLFLTDRQLGVMPREIIAEAGTGHVTRFIGTGPFEFVEFIPDRHIRLRRFAGYSPLPGAPDGYGGRREALVDELLFIPVPDAAVRTAGVQAGDFHFGEMIPPDDYVRLKATPNVVTSISIKPVAWLTVHFNRAPGTLMANQKLRQAILAAFDMELIMRAAFGHPDFWRLDPGVIMREHPMYTDAGKEWYNQRNPERARQLAREAGYRGETIRWLTSKSFPFMYISALVGEQMLEAAGFNVELVVLDWATVMTARLNPAAYEMASTAFLAAFDPILHLAVSPTWPATAVASQHPDMLRLLDEMRREGDPARRQQLWNQAQALFWEYVPSIKFGDYFNLHIHRPELQGYQPRLARFFWNVSMARR